MSWPRLGLAKARAKSEARESHFILLKVWGSEVINYSLKELEFRWTPESSESNYKGQNPLDQRVSYIIGKLLERRCLKWAYMTHFNIQNTSYGQKKGRESNWQFDSQPLKVGNHPNFLACKRRATYRWKVLGEGYNFALNLISIKGFHTMLWSPKVVRIPTLQISGLSLGNPETKWHLGVGPMAMHRI
jgi:hypothetical protein